MRSRRFALAAFLACVSMGPRLGGPALGEEPPPSGVYRFLIPAVDGRPGESCRVTVQGEHAQSVQGFSFALRYPSDRMSIDRVHATDTILEAIGTDYLEALVIPEEGILAVGVLVDVDPPFTGALIPSLGFPLDFIHLEVSIPSGDAVSGEDPDGDRDLVLRFDDTLETPPVRNLYAVDNQPVPVTELGSGAIRLPRPPASLFLRGDVNMDSWVDVSDPVAVLGYIFRGEGVVRCLAAADSNRDDEVDISDPIYLLNHLFNGGPQPPPPNLSSGPGSPEGPLGCEDALSG